MFLWNNTKIFYNKLVSGKIRNYWKKSIWRKWQIDKVGIPNIWRRKTKECAFPNDLFFVVISFDSFHFKSSKSIDYFLKLHKKEFPGIINTRRQIRYENRMANYNNFNSKILKQYQVRIVSIVQNNNSNQSKKNFF